MANVFQEPALVATKLPYRGKPSFASMVAMATRAAAAAEAEAREKDLAGGGGTAAAHGVTTPTAKATPAPPLLDGKETNLAKV